MDNAIDEVMNGHASYIEVELDADAQGVRIVDNGRGIPVDMHKQHKKPALELILTTLHAGGKFGGGNYQYSGGLHGVGASVVNALSSSMEAVVKRDGKKYRQTFARGQVTSALEVMGEGRGTGTSIHFRPDPEIFPVTVFNPEVIFEALEAKCYLHHVQGYIQRPHYRSYSSA